MTRIDLQDRRDERPDGGSDGDQQEGAATEIAGILKNITALISDADRRQGEALRELHDRLASLGRDARTARTQVPEEYVPAFERIEDGLTQIATKISRSEIDRLAAKQPPTCEPALEETLTDATGRPSHATAVDAADAFERNAPDEQPHPMHEAASGYVSPEHSMGTSAADDEEPAPAPLRSALTAAATLRGTHRTESGRPNATGVDPFDLVDSTRPGNADSPWDQDSAEALTRVYESLAGEPRLNKSNTATAPSENATEYDAQHFNAAQPVAEPIAIEPAAVTPPPAALASTSSAAAPASAAGAPVFDIGRDWLEARFAEIASRVEQSLSDMRSEAPAISIDSRLEQFENRFGQVMEGVATRSDLENLREFETHLDDLAQHVEQAQLQLQRLDTIEAQLNAVMEKLSDQRLSALLEQNGSSALDAERIAHAAAEQVAERMATIAPRPEAGEGDARRLDELRELLGSFMLERRQGEEQTAGMLDTMQQAMIRLLDRVDSLEFSAQSPDHVETDYAPAAEIAPAVTLVAASPTSAQPPVERIEAPAPMPPEEAKRSEAKAGEPAAKPTPVFAPETLRPEADEHRPQPKTGDVTREQLIAEARRAMQVAAAKREAEALIEAQLAHGGTAEDAAARKQRGGDVSAATSGIGKSTRRIMVGAFTLLLLSSAVLLLMPRKPANTGAAEPKTSQAKPAEKPGDQVVEQPQLPAPAKATAQSAEIEASPRTAAKPAPKAGDAEARVDLPRTSGPQAIPPGFLPRSIPETGVDDLANPHDPARDKALAQEASAAAAFPGITLHRNPEITGQAASQPRAVPVNLAESTSAGSAAKPANGEVPSRTTPPAEIPPAAIGPLSLRQAAAKGDPSAEFEVAARFAEGKGIQQSFPQAVRWYQRSASQGFGPAQYRLGTLYERGLGVKADAARAKVWYQRAAEQGHVKAMHNLAVLSAGRDSGAPDYVTAGRWFKEAGERGLADSQYNLAVLYETGLGMSKDLQQAYKWFAVAGRAGDKEALRRLDMLRAKLSTAEIASGELLVGAFQVKPMDRLVNDAHAAGEAWKARADVAG